MDDVHMKVMIQYQTYVDQMEGLNHLRLMSNGPANNSSLSVDLITNDLNGTTVSCSDGGTGEIIGSYNICIIGKVILYN